MSSNLVNLVIFSAFFTLSSYRANAQKDTVLYPVTKDLKTGYMNRASKLVVDYNYTFGDLFKNGFGKVGNHGRYGAIDATGAVVVPILYERLDYIPDQEWWFGKLPNDSFRIFKLDGSKDIYYGPGDFAHWYPRIKRIAISSPQRRSPHYCYLLNEKGRIIAERHAENLVSFNGLEQHTLTDPAGVNTHGLSYSHDGTSSITDLDGTVLYDSVQFLEIADGLIPLFGKNKAAVLDTQLNMVIPFQAGYERFQRMAKAPYFFAKKDSLSGIVDFKGKVVIPCQFSGQLYEYTKDLLEIANRADPRYVVYNYKGEQIVTSRNPISLNNEQMYGQRMPVPIQKNDTVYQLWDGKFIGKAYPFISAFGFEGYAIFIDGKKKGLLDSNGREVLVTNYEMISYPVNGILAAGERIDCPACDKYRCAQSVSDGKSSWIHQFFFLDLKGQRLSGKTYDFLQPYQDGQAIVSKDCSRFMINLKGSPIANTASYSFITTFNNGVRVVQNKEGNQALMNTSGKIISDWIEVFTLKDSRSVKDARSATFHLFADRRGNANSIGQIKVPDFTDGLVKFELDGRYGLMDSVGKIVVPARYKDMYLQAKHFVVRLGEGENERKGVIGTDGRMLVEPVYYEVRDRYYYCELVKNKGDATTLYVF